MGLHPEGVDPLEDSQSLSVVTDHTKPSRPSFIRYSDVSSTGQFRRPLRVTETARFNRDWLVPMDREIGVGLDGTLRGQGL